MSEILRVEPGPDEHHLTCSVLMSWVRSWVGWYAATEWRIEPSVNSEHVALVVSRWPRDDQRAERLGITRLRIDPWRWRTDPGKVLDDLIAELRWAVIAVHAASELRR